MTKMGIGRLHSNDAELLYLMTLTSLLAIVKRKKVQRKDVAVSKQQPKLKKRREFAVKLARLRRTGDTL
jgi:hypothetical protein